MNRYEIRIFICEYQTDFQYIRRNFDFNFETEIKYKSEDILSQVETDLIRLGWLQVEPRS